jgi:hypothetical protein
MSEVSAEPDVRQWQHAGSPAERRRRLFDSYVAARLSIPSAYSRERTLGCLHTLARILKRQGLSEFLVERMQPDWLDTAVQRAAYRASVLLMVAAIVLVVQESLMWVFGLIPPGTILTRLQESQPMVWARPDGPIDRAFRLLLPLVLGILVASRKTIIPIETLTWSWRRAWMNLLRWAQAGAQAGLDYGSTIGALVSVPWFLVVFRPEARSFVPTAGWVVGAVGGVLGALFLAGLRPATQFRSASWRMLTPRTAHALAVGGIHALVAVFGWSISWSANLTDILYQAFLVASSAGVFAIIALSTFSSGRSVSFLKASVTGLIAGATIGALSRIGVSSGAFLLWQHIWLTAGVASGLAAGMVISIRHRIGEWRRREMAVAEGRAHLSWWRPVLLGVLIGATLGSAMVTLTRVAGDQPVKDITLFMFHAQSSLLTFLSCILVVQTTVTVSVTILACVLSGLAGALSGAITGADVERRLVPNQGIRQSARNVAIFAVLGTVIIGVPYGVLNLVPAALATGALPSATDWLRLCASPAVAFGVMAGLFPGAACLQHSALRLVLSGSGALPLRWVSFLDLATQRRLIQRVGGRYRFIHVLLRDHLSDTPARIERASTAS